jgi:hypothetical protein
VAPNKPEISMGDWRDPENGGCCESFICTRREAQFKNELNRSDAPSNLVSCSVSLDQWT